MDKSHINPFTRTGGTWIVLFVAICAWLATSFVVYRFAVSNSQKTLDQVTNGSLGEQQSPESSTLAENVPEELQLAAAEQDGEEPLWVKEINEANLERIAEEKEAEDARIAADAKLAEEEQKAAEEKQDEEERLAAEDKQAEEERLVAAEEQAEEERLAAAEKHAEEERLAADEKQAEKARLAAAEKQAEEERLAAEEKQAEEARLAAAEKQAEEERLAAEEKQAEEARLAAEEERAEEERLAAVEKQAEEERIAAEEKQAEEARLAAEEEERAEEERLAAEAKQAEEERIAAEAKQAEEARLAAEAKQAEQERLAAVQKQARRDAAASTKLARYVELRNDELRVLAGLSDRLRFDSRSKLINRDVERGLDRIFDPLYLYSDLMVVVRVASNEYRGSADNNQLSYERGQSIASYLSRRGLDERRLSVQVESGDGMPYGSHRVKVAVEDPIQ